MTSPLHGLLGQHETAILRRWEERVSESDLGTRTGSPEQNSARYREALRAIRSALRADGPAAPLASAAGMARLELKRPGAERSQADTVFSLLLGREAIRDVLAPRVDAQTLASLVAELETAFRQVVSLFGQTTCRMCQSRQDEDRVNVERHLESILENSHDAIVLCDVDWSIRHWNSGAETIFGWPAEDILGTSLERLLPGGRWLEGVRESLSTELRELGHARIPELVLTRRDGVSVWVDASYTLVRGLEDQPLGVWILFRDVTEQRRLLDDRLHAERLALIGLMSAKFAHEIRNPLTSILINIDLLRDSMRIQAPGGEGDEDDETLGSIASEVNRIQNVVQDYLRFGRKPQISRDPIVLDDLLRRHLSMLAPELGLRGVALVLELGADRAIVDADEDQLWQAILNLARNGMEAMPAGGRLTISTRLEGLRVACTVADTGHGMEPEVQSEMFRPFFSTKRGGTGLGMPFVRQVVTEHNATLACRSEIGRGTSFVISLPIFDEDADRAIAGSLDGGSDVA